jgi:hypothetical protein
VLTHVDDDGIEHFRNRFRHLSEPPLEGAPASAKDSFFQSAPAGVIEAHDLTMHAISLVSDERSRLIGQTVTLMRDRPAFTERLLAGLEQLTDPEITASNKVRVEAQRVKEKIEERRYKLGHDIISPSADLELVDRASVDEIVSRFIKYRNMKPEKRRQHINQQARELIVNPQDIEYVFDTFNLMEESGIFSITGRQTMYEYAGDLSSAVETQIDADELPDPSDMGMEYWVTAWADGDNTHASKLIRTMIERADCPAETTDVMYRLLLAAAGSGKTEVMEAVLNLAASNRDDMPLDIDRAADLKAALYNEDLDVYDKAWEIQDAESVMTTLLVDIDQPGNREGIVKMQALIRARMHQTEEVNRSERYKKEVIRIGVEHNEHYEKAVERLRGPMQIKGLGMKDEGLLRRLAIWRGRAKAVKDVMSGDMASHMRTTAATGPLGEWTLDNSSYVGVMTSLRRSKSKVFAHLNLPGRPAGVHETTRQDASEAVRDKLTELKFEVPLAQRTYWNTLGYLTPKGFTFEDFPRFRATNSSYKEALIHDKVHSLSPRGDTVIISNDTLVGLGFESVTFSMHPERKDTTLVTLRVGNAAFQCYLDREYTMRELGTNRGIGLEASAPLLENIILGHLHQIHCTENAELTEEVEDTGPTQTVEYRRAHRRILPVGHNPQPNQIIVAWDEYGINLVKQNKHRLEAGESQLITWVSQVKPEHVIGRAPVRSRGDIASARLIDLLTND